MIMKKILSNVKLQSFRNKIFKFKINTFTVRNTFFMTRGFATNNQVNDKESLELVEAGVFEILKSAAKCKHEKLSRTATLEELGKY